ncbi:MAG: adenylosuccinate lyase [Bdellovibrionaceae bacterium]|nr:adenylosuccinate lyase [Pseudobdellovibrionaceae bacterium]MDW8190154.1 adenylosuccinate lyase [Pseudobdellovibrionaceae bacterium]
MIERYSTPEMKKIWDLDSRFNYMLRVEKVVAQVQAKFKIIPIDAARAIQSRASFRIDQILEREKVTKHDVIAFIQDVSERIGTWGRYFHYGLTSSDVLDTALSLQLQDAFNVLLKDVARLRKILKNMMQRYRGVICVGRTHGMWAEPTTFAIKLGGFLAELVRNEERIRRAKEINAICKLSGAVGTYSSLPPKVEKAVAKVLRLKVEQVATQVIPRDRHAEAYWALAMLLTGYERIATEIRHLQRSEVGEVQEGFSVGQKGSSAMPHKQNPIGSENLCGVARMLRSYLVAALENIPLWHERDISHSSVERVFLPDAFILAHYATCRLCDLLSSLQVNVARMGQNVQNTLGLIVSSHLLLYLVKLGFERQKAYEIVQRLSFEAKQKGVHLRQLILNSEELKDRIQLKELDLIFSGKKHLVHEEQILKRMLP